jgi:hypothetical protein
MVLPGHLERLLGIQAHPACSTPDTERPRRPRL